MANVLDFEVIVDVVVVGDVVVVVVDGDAADVVVSVDNAVVIRDDVSDVAPFPKMYFYTFRAQKR